MIQLYITSCVSKFLNYFRPIRMRMRQFCRTPWPWCGHNPFLCKFEPNNFLEMSPLNTALRPVFSQLAHLLRILLTFRMKPTARKPLIYFSFVSKVHPCTGTEALYRPYGPKGSRGIALLFHDHGTRRGWEVSVTPRPHFTPGKTRYPLYKRLGGAPGPVWTDAENLVPIGIRSPDRPARSQSLHRLRYPAHFSCIGHRKTYVRIYDISRRNQYSNSNVVYTTEKWWPKLSYYIS